eukprot:gene20358-20961_t
MRPPSGAPEKPISRIHLYVRIPSGYFTAHTPSCRRAAEYRIGGKFELKLKALMARSHPGCTTTKDLETIVMILAYGLKSRTSCEIGPDSLRSSALNSTGSNLLQGGNKPTDAQIDSAIGNICACGTYPRIRAAIHRAVNGG